MQNGRLEALPMQVDMRVLELLSSKICHDLVSPVSAINNGVELIEDIGGDVVDEAMKLIGASAAHASRRLRLFRMAYGRAGNEASLPLRDVRQTAEQYMAGGKVTLNWPDDQPSEALTTQPGFLKTILNMTILAEEALAYGGVVSLRAATEGDVHACRFEVVGRAAQLSEAMEQALLGTAAIDDLSPRTIQAYITGRFAETFGFKLSANQSIQDRLDLTLAGAPALIAV